MPGKFRSYEHYIVPVFKVMDAVLGVAVLGACQWIYQRQAFAAVPYQVLGLLVVLLSPLCMNLGGIYRSWRTSRLGVELRMLVTGCVLVDLCLLAMGYMFKESQTFSRVILLSWAAAWPCAMLAARIVIRKILRHVRRRGRNTRTAVVVGAGDLGLSVARHLLRNRWMGITVRGYFDDKKTGVVGERSVLGATQDLSEYVRRNHIDYVYLALPMRAEEKVKRLVAELSDSTATVFLVPDIFQFELLLSGSVNYLGEIPAIALWDSPFLGFNAALKRLLDLVLGGLILIGIAPLLALIALAVKLSSPGPVFFVQWRYGLGGQPFKVYKFRSMRVCEDGYCFMQATKGDARVTSLGAFLRRTSLDELPQFLNVLQGEMSIVGPRPHAVAMNEEYRKRVAGYMLRHKVKPGITGLAQVNGYRGETDTLEKMEGRIRYDLQYMRTWSPLLDVKIILQTVVGGFVGKNAY